MREASQDKPLSLCHPLPSPLLCQPQAISFSLSSLDSTIYHLRCFPRHSSTSFEPQKPTAMASLTSAAVTIPSFTGLKAGAAAAPRPSVAVAAAPRGTMSVRASLKEVGAAVVATAASAMLAGNALAFDVLLGAGDGSLVFEPKEFSVPAGEQIIFKNNAGFPHNVVFDEDAIPAGVDASAISMDEEDYLNAAGETYKVTLKEKGTYSFYCAPHAGAGMVGKVTVN